MARGTQYTVITEAKLKDGETYRVRGSFRLDTGFPATRLEPEEGPEISEILGFVEVYSVTHKERRSMRPDEFWDWLEEVEMYDAILSALCDEHDRARNLYYTEMAKDLEATCPQR